MTWQKRYRPNSLEHKFCDESSYNKDKWQKRHENNAQFQRKPYRRGIKMPGQ